MDNKIQAIDKKLREVFDSRKFAGMSIAITDKEKIIYTGNFGVASVEMPNVPVSEYSLHRIASITKIFTGLTIMRLVEDGVLDLDKPIKSYVPWLTLSDKRAQEAVTLRHLLSHTAGLPMEYTPEGAREEAALESSLMEGLPTLTLSSLPGENKYVYSNWGIRLASYVAERQTGVRYSELAHKYVIDPLGMKYTSFDIRDAITRHVSLPHEIDGNGELYVVHHMKENAARLAAGGLYSNAVDLSKLARMILNNGINDEGERIVSAGSLAEMSRIHADASDGAHYGITMRLYEHDGIKIRGHLGSAPPYATSLYVADELGLGVIVLMNTEYKELRDEIPKAVFSIFKN